MATGGRVINSMSPSSPKSTTMHIGPTTVASSLGAAGTNAHVSKVRKGQVGRLRRALGWLRGPAF